MNTKCENCTCEKTMVLDRLLDQNEVAVILCLSPKTLEFYRWKGLGPRFVKMGKLVRYRESDVKAYVENLGGLS